MLALNSLARGSLPLAQFFGIAHQLLLLPAQSGHVGTQGVNLLLELEHVAAHLRVFVNQAVLRCDGLIQPLTQLQDGLACLVVTKQLRLRRTGAHKQGGQRGGAQHRSGGVEGAAAHGFTAPAA